MLTFIQVVKIMVALGQVSLNVQYIDGTKIESVANKYTFVWKKATLTNKTKLEEKIKSVLKQIGEGIAQDNAPSKEEGTMTDAIDSEHLQQLIDKVNEENSRLAQGSKEDKKKTRQRQKAVMEAFSALFGLFLPSLWILWDKFRKEESSVNKIRQLSNRNLIAA